MGLKFVTIAMLLVTPKLFSQATTTNSSLVSIPYVGCKSDGQVGPLAAPRGSSKQLRIPAEAAQKLAYYKAKDSPGVLGPRGWFCFSTYGSNGASLYLSPQPIRPADLFSDKWHGFTGPAIQLSLSIGDTSGRFEVAQAIARVFPAHRDFADRVIAEGIEPASDFPRGPYPQDKLTYRSKEIVEYETQANQEGFGSHTRLAPDSSPVTGVLVLDPKGDVALYQLAMRLPPGLRQLAPIIREQVERPAK